MEKPEKDEVEEPKKPDEEKTPVEEDRGVEEPAPIVEDSKDEETAPEPPESDKNVFEAVIATQSPLPNYINGEDANEILLCTEEAVDMTRLKSGNAPVVIEHSNEQIGVVEDAWIVDNTIVARYRISETAGDILTKIKEKIMKNVSIKYRVNKYNINENGDYEAIKWEVFEMSIVIIPADPMTGTRGIEMCAAANINTREALDLVKSCRSFNELASKIKSITVEKERNMPKNIKDEVIEVGKDEREVTREGIVEALECRAFGKEVTEKARPYAGRSLVETTRTYLKNSGVDVDGMNADMLSKRAFVSTSDLPNIFANVATKSLLAGYELAQPTYQPFVREYGVPDFKSVKAVRLSQVGKLKKINEGGEVTESAMSDSGEELSLATYGRSISFTRRSIINDDLNALTIIPQSMGQRVQEKKNELFWAIITDNNAMSDGINLFHASHGNLAGSGAGISIATLSAGRAAMRIQKAMDAGMESGSYMNIPPRYLIVPAAKETDAEQITASISPVVSGEVNPFSAKLIVVTEALLDANSTSAWYLAADKNKVPMFDMIYLNGAQSPTIETFTSADILGIKMRVIYDCAVAVTDYRGLYKNPGA